METKERKRTLYVEGKNDAHVIRAICKSCKVEETFVIEEKRGLHSVKETVAILEVALSAPDEYPDLAVGIIVDADERLEDRWRSICKLLSDKGYETPDRPGNGGTILRKEGRIPFGVWIMPDNQLPGELEDFMRLLVPEQDPLLQQAEESLGRIEAAGIQRYPAQDRSKALIHTWLAWQELPGKPMGQSIGANYFDVNQPVCAVLVSWLKNLFNA